MNNGKGDKWRPTDMDKYRNSPFWENSMKDAPKLERPVHTYIENVYGENYNACICHKCIEENQVKQFSGSPFLLNSTMMSVCPKCDNKRCPHASDHQRDCTGSNETGQSGSIYE